MRSGEQLSRLLRLVPYLAAHPGTTVPAVAAQFDVPTRQIIRDLEVLQFCGLPGGLPGDLFEVDIDAVREDGVIDFQNAEVLNRPLRLRTAEAASLLAALRLVVDVAGESAAAGSALAKLQDAVGNQDDKLSVTVAPTDPGARDRLSQAIAESRLVRLGYRRSGQQTDSEAEVEPRRLRLVDGYTYLDAWSRSRRAWRSYRLDRINAVELLDERFEPVGEPPTGWFDDAPEQVRLTVRDSGRWIAEYYPTTAVEETPAGLSVTFPVVSREWAVGLVLRLGDAVVEVSDAELLAEARGRALGALAHYRAEVQ